MSGLDGLVGVAGHPIDHSLSPRLHHAAFEALGLDWESRRFDVERGGGAGLLETMANLRIRGLSITMPLKEELATLVDRLDPLASVLGSVNCLVLEDGRIEGLSTDGPGLLAALAHAQGFEVADKRVLVVGAGGAARAVVAACAAGGAAEVSVIARKPERAASVALLAGRVGRVAVPTDASLADLIVESTPIGMAGTPSQHEASLIDPDLLGEGQLAVDLVYHPRRTLWLEMAAHNGAATEGGLGMLVHQAALQIERWTGQPAPLSAMWASVAEVA